MPAGDPTHTTPSGLLEAWHRLCGAIDQAVPYVEEVQRDPARAERPDRWVLVIVVHQAFASEITGFRYAAAAWGLLKDTPFCALAVLTPAALEQLALTSTADEAGRLIERQFLEASMNALEQPPDGPEITEGNFTPYLQEGWKRLLGVDLPAPSQAPP